MNAFDVTVAVGSALALLVGVLPRPIARSPIVEPMIALAAGIALGPYGLDVLDAARWPVKLSAFFEQATRITLGLGLVSIALRIPARSLRAHARSLAVLLGVGMPLMWLA